MTPDRLAELKREFEWHLSQPAASITSTRLSRFGMELALAVEELEQRLADARGGPGGGMTE